MPRLNSQLVDWLNMWGDWRERPVIGLGYPSMTQEARLYSSPGRASQQSYCPEYRQSPIAQRVDAAMLEIDAELQIALWWQYVAKRGIPGIQRYNRCSRGAARWKLELAHRAISRQLKVEVYR